MSGKLIEIAVMEGVAAVMFAFAWQIGVKGNLDLIAGYNEKTASRVTDRNGLKRLISRLCVLLGIGSAVMPAITWLASGYPDGLAYSIGGYIGFITGLIGLVALQSRDYVS